jgi:hypothetical protein
LAYVDASTRAVQVIYSSDEGSSWQGPFTTGQTSHHSPGLTAFNGALWLACIGASTGNVELVSSLDGSRWSPKTDTKRSSKSGVALATIPAASGPDPLAGHSNCVTGAVCTVANETGATIGALSLDAIGLPLAKEPGTVDDSWLAPIVALELDIVGYSEGAFTTFQSGRAFAVYNALPPLKVNGSYAS